MFALFFFFLWSLCATLTALFVFLSHPLRPQKLLFSLGGSFLYYADHFKLYSGFCANHIKVQKVLERGTTRDAIRERDKSLLGILNRKVCGAKDGSC